MSATAAAGRPPTGAPTPGELAASRNAFALLLTRYARAPAAFVQEILGAQPDAWQLDVLTALAHGQTRISIRSGHGVGKSTLLAWSMLWFLLTRFPVKVVVTAPSAPQLFDALWAELRAWLGKLPEAWLVLLDVQSDHVALKLRPDEAFISARTSRAETPDSLQGVHSRNVLLVVDEAAGVPEQVFEAAGGSMSTPGAITIFAGNPTRSTGMFWRTHTLEAGRWFCKRVSSLDSPRVDPAYGREIAERYGTDSNHYRVRVLGEFPLAEGDTLIPAVLVEDAMRRLGEIDAAAPEIWGVDVARFGTDQSCLIKRKGSAVIEPPRRWTGFDTMQLTGAIMAEWKKQGPAPPAAIVVDAIGIGAGVADRLRELRLPAIDVNVSESPSSEGRFVRLRDELWQAVRDWLDSRTVSLPWDDLLRNDLCAPRYGFSSDGKLKIESKDQLRSRGIPSPDCFIAGTLIATPTGHRPVESLAIGDVVLTPFGPTPIVAAWIDWTDTLTRADFSNGASLVGTGKHKVFCWGDGIKRLDALCLTDSVEPLSSKGLAAWRLLSGLRIEARCSEFRALVDTISQTGRVSPSAFYIAVCGQTCTVLFRRALTCITRMRTGGTTRPKTLSLSTPGNTSASTCCDGSSSLEQGSGTSHIWRWHAPLPPNGIGPTRGAPGTANTEPRAGETVGALHRIWSARFAANHFWREELRSRDTVRWRADRKPPIRVIRQIAASARSVAASFWRTVTERQPVVPILVRQESAQPTAVYNLTLSKHNAYYANGILVFNSGDALCLTFSPGAYLAAAYGVGRLSQPLRRNIRGVV